MARRRKGGILVALNADTSQLKRELSGLNIGKLLKGGIATAGIAGVGTLFYSLKQSADAAAALDTEMRQVFTLMPDIPLAELDTWKGKLVELNREYGLLSDDSGRALYQAISAGVDASEVFEFLGVAAETSVGGVASLTESVDLLTSVVNAYADAAPEDIVDVNRAADALFTTVRLGKTTIPELASSIAQLVAPARGAGMALEEPLAALAALTASGVPTSQAATMIRSAIQDFTKEGQTLKQFRDIMGMTVLAFIEGGAELDDVFAIFNEEAIEAGTAMTDFFGRVEAGMGATLLQDSKRYKEILEEFGQSAGAADAAFEIMAEGAGFKTRQVSAAWNSMLEKIGTELLPPFFPIADAMIDVLADLAEWGAGAARKLVDAWYAAFPTIQAIWRALRNAWENAITAMRAVWDELIRPVVDTVIDTLGGPVSEVADVVVDAADTIWSWISGQDTSGEPEWIGAWRSSLREGKEDVADFVARVKEDAAEVADAWEPTREEWSKQLDLTKEKLDEFDEEFGYLLEDWAEDTKTSFGVWRNTGEDVIDYLYEQFLSDLKWWGETGVPAVLEYVGWAVRTNLDTVMGVMDRLRTAWRVAQIGMDWVTRNVTEPMLDRFKERWSQWAKDVTEDLKDPETALQRFALATGNSVLYWLAPLFADVLYPVGKFVFEKLTGLFDGAREAFKKFANGFKLLWETILKPAFEDFKGFIDKIVDVLQLLGELTGITGLLRKLFGGNVSLDTFGVEVDLVGDTEPVTPIPGALTDEDVSQYWAEWARTQGGGDFVLHIENLYGSADQQFQDLTEEAIRRVLHQNGLGYLTLPGGP